MHILRTFLLLVLFSLLTGFTSFIFARTGPICQTLSRVPTDSIIILSVDMENIIHKSGIFKNPRWIPLLNRLEKNGLPLREWFTDSNHSGIAWKEPIQFFVRLIEGERPYPQFGAIAKIISTKHADNTLANLANTLGLRSSPNNPKIYQRTTQPFAIGRSGNFCFLLGTLLFRQENIHPSLVDDLQAFSSSLSAKPQTSNIPTFLARHAKHTADIGLYIEGTGNGRIFQSFQKNTLIESIIPLFDPLFHHSFGIFLRSQSGSLHLHARNYSSSDAAEKKVAQPLAMIDKLPGDAPLVMRLSLPETDFHNFLIECVGSALRFLSAGKIGADDDLPGFDLSARELLKFPSGDFVFAGGDSRTSQITIPNRGSITQISPVWATGMKILQPLALQEILAGMNGGMGSSSLLNAHQLRINKSKESVWLSSSEYSREIKLGKPIVPLAFYRRKLLNNHRFALDFNPVEAARSLRQPDNVSFDLLKKISWLDEFQNLSLRLDEFGVIHGKLKLSRADSQGWQILADRLGQEWIDQINARLFLAITRDDLNEVIEAVAMGALINANDRFGHSPLHYAAYRGNAYIVDYLLRHGGDPNTRGNHLSTPLHSASWGKNLDIVELLLEDGADVDAKTDELETPIMTATLRGQLEMVETLLALSADAHAVDKYGSNLMDLAGASGNKQLVELLKEVGVKNSHPLHLAAGTGDFDAIKSLLESGRSINEQDSFGATPLLIATVAGREEMVDYLLRHSADPRIEAKDGYSLLHGAAFSGKKSLVRKMLSYGLDINQRYGTDKITPTDVGEEGSEGLLYLRSMGGRSAWELGPQ